MFKERFQEEFLFKVTNNTKKSTKNEEFSESCAKVFFPRESIKYSLKVACFGAVYLLFLFMFNFESR